MSKGDDQDIHPTSQDPQFNVDKIGDCNDTETDLTPENNTPLTVLSHHPMK